jgi:hypothetical protein
MIKTERGIDDDSGDTVTSDKFDVHWCFSFVGGQYDISYRLRVQPIQHCIALLRMRVTVRGNMTSTL